METVFTVSYIDVIGNGVYAYIVGRISTCRFASDSLACLIEDENSASTAREIDVVAVECATVARAKSFGFIRFHIRVCPLLVSGFVIACKSIVTFADIYIVAVDCHHVFTVVRSDLTNFKCNLSVVDSTGIEDADFTVA